MGDSSFFIAVPAVPIPEVLAVPAVSAVPAVLVPAVLIPEVLAIPVVPTVPIPASTCSSSNFRGSSSSIVRITRAYHTYTHK